MSRSSFVLMRVDRPRGIGPLLELVEGLFFLIRVGHYYLAGFFKREDPSRQYSFMSRFPSTQNLALFVPGE